MSFVPPTIETLGTNAFLSEIMHDKIRLGVMTEKLDPLLQPYMAMVPASTICLELWLPLVPEVYREDVITGCGAIDPSWDSIEFTDETLGVFIDTLYDWIGSNVERKLRRE